VRYLPPFELLKSRMTMVADRGRLMVSGSYEEFVALLRTLIAGVEVDEAWYLKRYPDIADGIRAGTIRSAQAHFVESGFFEGRQPFPIALDEPYYLARYPGIADAIRDGVVSSAQQHFDENGYREGRHPFPHPAVELF
jgi:hypothetical protein